jgi:DNA segregation ATPase FtsK/SpoIIIE, S-DNA-T family
MVASNGQSPGLGQEIAAVAGLFLALFLFICLGSYSLAPAAGGGELLWADGATAAVATGGQASVNWGGAVGQMVAGMVMSFLGISAFLLPLLLLAVSLQAFSPSFTLQRLPFVLLGASGMLLAGSSLAGHNGGEVLALFGNLYPKAGHLGGLLADLGHRALGGPGSLLFFLALFVISLMLTLDFSPYLFFRRIITGGWSATRRAWSLSAGLRSWAEQRWVRGGSAGKSGEARIEMQPGIGETPALNFFDPDIALLELDGETGQAGAGGSAKAGKSRKDGQGGKAASDTGFRLQTADPPGGYRLPPLSLLDRPPSREQNLDKEYYFEVSRQLEEKLADFNVVGKVVGISPGPVITTYEFAPAPGVKINRIVALAEDLALGLKVESVRIAGSLPGKGAIGIEVPNPRRQIVPIRDIFAHETFQQAASRLTMGLGMDVVGNPVVADLSRMPHLLIAGATGSGKSVAVNTIICSILYNAAPDEVRLLLVDPKRIELSAYESIPHLLHPVVVDPKLASRALQWAVREMERRYQLMEEARVKSLAGYNQEAEEKLPLIVIIIDELADLMMVSSREVEDAVARLAQMARAAGMHLILATQRPSVDVLTGLIKANFPTRMSFKVSSKIDSRTILDGSGAEHLLGAGDMLFMPPGSSKLQRIHGAYISEQEIERVVSFLKAQGTAEYDPAVLEIAEAPEDGESSEDDGTLDEHYDRAVALVTETGQASISMVQRRLRVGYNRAARMIETMEKEGIVGPADGAKPREVLVRKSY